MLDLMTAADVARVVEDLSPAGVRNAANTGRLKVATCTPGGTRLFCRDDVEEFRRARRQRREDSSTCRVRLGTASMFGCRNCGL